MTSSWQRDYGSPTNSKGPYKTSGIITEEKFRIAAGAGGTYLADSHDSSTSSFMASGFNVASGLLQLIVRNPVVKSIMAALPR